MRIAEDADIQDLLDALVAGEFDQDEFLREILLREVRAPGVAAEALAALEVRRAQLSHKTYVCVKARLQLQGARASQTQATQAAMPQPAGGPRVAAPAPTNQARANPVMQSSAPAGQSPATPAQPAAAPTPAPPGMKAGDVLAGRYRITRLQRLDAGGKPQEMLAERIAGPTGIVSTVVAHVLDAAVLREPARLDRIGKLQGLSHPALVRVLDVEEQAGTVLLITEQPAGITLRDLLQRNGDRRLAVDAGLLILRTVAGALLYMHGQGVAHGNVGRQNVLITDGGDIRLQGFELHRNLFGELPADRRAFARLAYDLLTGAGVTAEETARPAARAPAGVSREQWRAVSGTLLSTDGAHSNQVLVAFAGDPARVAPAFFPAQAFVAAGPARPRIRAGDWAAMVITAAMLGTGGYLLLKSEPAQVAGSAAIPAAAAQAAPEPASVPSRKPTAPAAAPPAPVVAAAEAAAAPPAATTRAEPPFERAVVDLSATAVWVDTSESFARIWVRRRGPLNKPVTFQWWTETGSAQVGRDFRQMLPNTEVIPAGEKGISLLVQLIPDAGRREPRTFFVKIDRPGPGATLGSRTLAQVAIVPPEYPAARDARPARAMSTLTL
ncbi:MAG: protein kinase [Steroidobacteraceae bacterium]